MHMVLEIILGPPISESQTRKKTHKFGPFELFLVPLLFGPPSMVAAVVNF